MIPPETKAKVERVNKKIADRSVKVGDIADKLEELVGFWPIDREIITEESNRLEMTGVDIMKMLEWKANRLMEKENRLMRREVEVVHAHFEAGNDLLVARKRTFELLSRHRNEDVAFLVSLARLLCERLSQALELARIGNESENILLELLNGRNRQDTQG